MQTNDQNNVLNYAGGPLGQSRVAYSRILHRLALATAIATFPLIFMGGLVTSHGAGMSVPDWPNSYGYNMFTFPPSMWVGGIFYEHTHRLMGTVVGLLSIALAVCAWIVERRMWVRWLTIGVLGAVIVQGVLGGLRVVWVDLDLAVIHGCFAHAFFCLAALAAVVTSRWWIEQNERVPTGDPDRRLAVLGTIAVAVIFAQLVVGATMRHYDAGLAIPDLPLAYGQVMPPINQDELARANALRAWDHAEPRLKPVTLGQIWLHFGHRTGAILVTGALGVLLWRACARHRGTVSRGAIALTTTTIVAGLVALGFAHGVGSTRGPLAGFPFFASGVLLGLLAWRQIRAMGIHRPILAPAATIAALLIVQITLGVLTVLWRKPADVASAHVAVGALTLVTTFLLSVRAARIAQSATIARHATKTRTDEGLSGDAVLSPA